MNKTQLIWTLVMQLVCLPAVNGGQPDPQADASGKASGITRTIDASQYFRRFPRLPAGRNTSIQKAPAPVLAEVSAREFGKPEITKCWLNLDEMWDYRTRQYDFNYRIGVHKYDDVKEKHRETWGSVEETNIRFHDYLQAFGKHSDEIMLTIRRYERDILDGKLGVTMADWREMFKKAVVHYRQLCPNLRYVEVCNEYALSGFIGCTADEYYEFYKTAYQAVNEANEELGLKNESRVLVGGPAVTGDIVGKLDSSFENFSKDPCPHKRLDFVSWHEYGKSYHGTALREGQVQGLLESYRIPKAKPMFVTEHDPVHGTLGTHELNLVNGAGLVKSLYFSSVYSPGMIVMPWVQYHIREIQTQFMWFDGPNEPDTRADELRMLPSGCSMKLLSMHKEWEIAVDNGLDRDELVLASVENDGLAVHAVNYGQARDVRIRIDNLPQVFTALHTGRLRFAKYQIDETHSNGVANPSYSGGPQQVGQGLLAPENGSVTLTHARLAKNGILMWMLVPERVGAVLSQPVSEILTPPPPSEPRINGAKVFGVRPGHPLLYTIAATGRRPMRFSAANLPAGLQVDQHKGRITGSLAKRGTYRVRLRAENALGHAERELRIVVGDELLLTPLLGCNTWGGWGAKVTHANLRAAAKAIVDTGLVNHGWQYINIDDGWQGHRGGPYNAIQPNEKFPDMKALCDYIHSLGLKAGIYSTPWTTSYAGFVGGSSDDPDGAWQRPTRRRDGWRVGKYLFETNDARQWAAWGFDYAKYDWDVDRVELTRRMADALAACDRDIVMELSNSVPLEKAAEHTSLAQLSRTTGDLVDFWDRSQMPPEIRGWAEGIREVWLAHDAWAPYQKPGHWNHACNIRVGLLGGWRDKPLTPTHLTPDEQYTHISLWCLWGSPMIIGTPIERLDPFTVSLLSNDEVLEINQDPLGIQGRRATARGGEAVVKPLEDGSKAVGLLNPGTEPAQVTIDWSTLGLTGKQQVRDLWRQKDLGVHSEEFTAEVRPHGVVLVRLAPVMDPEHGPGEN